MNRVQKTTVVALAVSTAFVMSSAAHAAVLLTSNFGDGTDKTLVAGAGVTITQGIVLNSISEQSNDGSIRLQSGIVGDSFSSTDDFVSFGIKTTDPTKQFSLNSASALIAFDNDRVFGDDIAQRMVVYGGSDATGPVLFTSPETIGDDDNTHNGPFAAIVGPELFFQIQYRNSVENDGAGATLLDNIEIEGDIVDIPEPASLTLLGLGGLLIVGGRRRR